MVICAFQNAFQDREVRHNTTGVEVLGAIEDNFVAFRSNLEIAVARIDGSANELSKLQSDFKHWIDSL